MKKELISRFGYDPVTGLITNTGTGSIAGVKHVKGYLTISYKGKGYLAHRLAWLLYYGEWPEKQIDHINHDKKDNRIKNLRCVSNFDNHRNMPRQKNNKSGVTGVFWYERYMKWTAYIKVSGHRKHLGYFELFDDAVKARKDAEKYYGFHKNHGCTL